MKRDIAAGGKMEELFVGNSVILLFWVYVTFIIEVKEKNKKIILMYLITYITNVLNIVPTIQSYMILLLALFIEVEFWEDKFKIQIVNNVFEKILDFLYIVITQYALTSFTIALFFGSEYMEKYLGHEYRYIISGCAIYLSCKNVAGEKYKICTFEKMKAKIDGIVRYRNFLDKEKCICEPFSILYIEDSSFYSREERYTLVNRYYLQKQYYRKIKSLLKKFFCSTNKVKSVKKFLRGYSTVEMQLLRTLAIEEGYDYIIRRKIFEVLYARLFLKNLRKYYQKCDCDVDEFKDFLLYLYLRVAPCLNRGGETRVKEVIMSRKKIEDYSKEELFILTLCFSGKIKRANILEIYGEVVKDLNLDMMILEELVEKLNC